MIIGLVGKNCSGKGAVVRFLQSRGFGAYSLSDVIRQEIQRRGKKITRERLTRVGNELREEGGPSVLADRIVGELEVERHYVIDSIRNPAEVRSLRRLPEFILLSIDADEKVRFERMCGRGRESDPRTLEEFHKAELAELENEDPTRQNIRPTEAMADFTIQNNGTMAELHGKLIDVIKKAKKRFPRPDWDDYFFDIARQVALRSNCIKRRVAALIVKDLRIISTGYNGTPRGTKNCDEGGCPRCNDFSTSGANLGECVCSHAEENAITQAAYHGVSVKGTSIYTTLSPCLICTKMIINSGIGEVVYCQDYPLGDAALALLKEAGVKVRQHK